MATFDVGDLHRIVHRINVAHPAVCKDALATHIKKELESFMVAMSTEFGAETVARVCRRNCELEVSEALQSCVKVPMTSDQDGAWTAPVQPSTTGTALAVKEKQPVSIAPTATVLPPIDKVPTILQFGSSVYFADENKGIAEIDIVRLGDTSGTTTVKYATMDASAVAGIKYEGQEGVLEYKPQELSKTVVIRLLTDDLWDTTVEFGLQLTHPKGGELFNGAQKARVKILDDDDFPTNKFKQKYAMYGLAGISKVSLFVEYCKMGLRDRTIRRPAVKCLIYDQIQNLNLIFFLLIKLYLIDIILNADETGFIDSDSTLLVAVASAMIAAQLATSATSIHRVSLRIGGKSRMKLQSNLLRKFLNYDECLRSTVGLSDLMLSITHHSPELVNNGFLVMFDLLQELGKMGLLVVYQVWLSSRTDSGAEALWAGIAPVIFIPICMSLFLYIRHPATDRLKLKMMTREKNLASVVESVAHNARTIIDYSGRVKTMERIEDLIHELNHSVNGVRANNVVNNQFAPCLAYALTATYVVLGGHLVLNGALSLGTFLVTIDMYQRIAALWGNIYKVILLIHSVLPSLEIIFWHMNLATDLFERRDLNQVCCSIGVEERKKAREKRKEDGVLFAIDMLPIRLGNVSFNYKPETVADLNHQITSSVKSIREAREKKNDVKAIPADPNDKAADIAGIQNINVDLQQGKLIAFVGRRGQGKTTLLKIIGGVLLPKGDYYMPTHLKVIHVMQQPVFFEATLMDNLCYGVRAGSPDANMDRVLAICRCLMVSEQMIQTIIAGEVHQWDEHLSLTQKVALHIARALIANPEVLVIHKPLITFDTGTARAVMETLQHFVQERGLFATGDPRLRRRRTCILSLTRVEVTQLADVIIEVSKTGVKEVKAEEVTNEMMGAA